MITKKDINWYLESPNRLELKKPFIRGGELTQKSLIDKITLTTKTTPIQSSLHLHPITQDTYLQEYDPSLHRIKFNRSIPHIAVSVGGQTVDIDDLTVTAAYQKNIHAAHVLHLAAQPMEFTLCNIVPQKPKSLLDKVLSLGKNDNDNNIGERFQEFKQEWVLRNMESIKYDVISKQKKVGDVGLLYSYDKTKNKLTCKVYSYDEGYIVIPNYNEIGEQIACSIYYSTDDGTKLIDTYDDRFHYRIYEAQDGQETESGWIVEKEPHGFSRCPLLYKRGKVAWEYAESSIEMWELMANINAVTLKRFGTFGLVLTGEMDENSFKRDASTLIINLSSDTSGGKQSADVIKFPEPQNMLAYLDYLETKISIFSSVSFITPKDITSTGSGGNGIFLAMKNDLALATQSVSDWADFTNDMAYLFQEGISLESDNTNKYTDLKICARLKPWSMETEATKITNLAMESKWLSRQSIIEKSPDAAPDELDRIEKEAKEAQDLSQSETDAGNVSDTKNDTIPLKAEKISKNGSSEIQGSRNKQTYSNVNNT